MSLCELKLYREFEQKVLENYQNKMFMGIVENKYYTPSIEDIRVGYEYESLQKQQDGSEKWVPQKIVRRYDLEGDWENWLYYGIVKTPYLTKEQIEAEGWKIENVLIQDDDDNDMFSTGFVKDIDENHWYELFFQGDKISIQYTASNVYKKAYADPVSTYSIPGLNPVNKNPENIPNLNDTLEVNDVFILNKSGDLSLNATASVIAYEPYGNAASKSSSSENRLVNTVGQKSTDTEEFFADEKYRLPLNFDFNSKPASIVDYWNSTNPLTNGNAQCFIVGSENALVYPSRNFSSGCKPANNVNYSGFTGNQLYARAFKLTGKSGITLNLGVTGGIAPVGADDINIEIKLPGLTGWCDAAKPYDSAYFAAHKTEDGCGILNGAINGGIVKVTFGGLSTVDSSGIIYVRITLRNNNRYITKLTIS